MKHIKTYYSSVVFWANLLVGLVICSCYSKSYMIDNPSLEQEAIYNCPSSSRLSTFDDVLQKINTLFEKFKECSSYVNEHKASYTIPKIIELDSQFQAKQVGYGHQHFMSYNQLIWMDDARISSDHLHQVMKLKASPNVPITLHMLIYLHYWEKAASERLSHLLRNRFIKTKVLDQSAAASTMVMTNNTQVDVHKLPEQKPVSKKVPPHKTYASRYINDYIKKPANKISDYVDQDIIPYWGKVAEVLIFRLLNSSLAEGKISIQAAKENYQKIFAAIEGIYSPDYLKACEACLNDELKNAMAYKSSKYDYVPIKIIEKLEQCFLKPIDDMYVKLNTLIDDIACRNDHDTRLKEKVRHSLGMFYNIVYGFKIINLIPAFGGLTLIYNASMSDFKKQDRTSDLPTQLICCLRSSLYFTSFITSNDTKLDQTNSQVYDLTNYVRNLLK